MQFIRHNCAFFSRAGFSLDLKGGGSCLRALESIDHLGGLISSFKDITVIIIIVLCLEKYGTTVLFSFLFQILTGGFNFRRLLGGGRC